MSNKMNFVSFPEIEGFHNTVKSVKQYPHIAGDSRLVSYRGKIKLHGTNAGIRIKDGVVAAQSRSKIITPQDDNVGFAKWVEEHKEFFKFVGKSKIWNENASEIPMNDITIFGEWCGPGIMKGTAINQLSTKIFAIFAIVIGDSETGDMIHDPAIIDNCTKNRPDDIHVLPWYGDAFIVDFTNRLVLTSVAETLSKIVEDIEPCDPWVKNTFGFEGVCEGIVYYPYHEKLVIQRKQFSDLAFKAKGEKHKVVKTKQIVQVDPEIAKSISQFVDMFVTEARCEQGLNAIGGINIKNTGQFLKWMMTDIIKESKDELAASELTFEQVQKETQTAAKDWFMTKCKTI